MAKASSISSEVPGRSATGVWRTKRKAVVKIDEAKLPQVLQSRIIFLAQHYRPEGRLFNDLWFDESDWGATTVSIKIREPSIGRVTESGRKGHREYHDFVEWLEASHPGWDRAAAVGDVATILNEDLFLPDVPERSASTQATNRATQALAAPAASTPRELVVSRREAAQPIKTAPPRSEPQCAEKLHPAAGIGQRGAKIVPLEGSPKAQSAKRPKPARATANQELEPEESLSPAKTKYWLFVPSHTDDMHLSPMAFRVYAHLCRRANGKSEAFPSISQIRKVCGGKRNTIVAAIRELERHCLIQVIRKPGLRNRYLLVGPKNQSPYPKGYQSTAKRPVSEADPGRIQKDTGVVHLRTSHASLGADSSSEGIPLRYSNKGRESLSTRKIKTNLGSDTIANADAPGRSLCFPKRKKQASGKEPNQKPSLEELTKFCTEELAWERGEAEDVNNQWLANGFTEGGQPIRDWQALLRHWDKLRRAKAKGPERKRCI